MSTVIHPWQILVTAMAEPDDRAKSPLSSIECAQRLGGMLRFYHRAAA